MATLTRGYTFGATEQVTNSKLHSLVDSSSISSIAQSDLVAAEGLVSRATSSPSDTDQLWSDTSTTPPTLKIYDGSNWVPVAEHAILTNKTGQTTSVGQVVIIDTDNANSFEFTSTAGDPKFRGILVEAIANNSTQDVIGRGDLLVQLEISASAGCFLRTSTATGKAEPVASTSSGIFGIVQQAGTASARSYVFGNAIAASAVAAASQTEMEAASSTTVFASPGRTKFHPGVAKAWIVFNGSGTPAISSSYNIDTGTGITDNGDGDYTIPFDVDFSGTTYCVVSQAWDTTVPIGCTVMNHTKTAGTLRINVFREATGTLTDAEDINIVVYGDQ
jgi:hypothetical protein